MPRVRVRESRTYGSRNQYKSGDILVVTSAEYLSFGDKFDLLDDDTQATVVENIPQSKPDPKLESTKQEETDGETGEEETTVTEPVGKEPVLDENGFKVFNFDEANVRSILIAVRDKLITATEAYDREVNGKNRVTLLNELKNIIDGKNEYIPNSE